MDQAERLISAIERARDLAERTRRVMHLARNERHLATLLCHAAKRQRAERSRASTLARMLGHENLPLQP